MRLLGLDLGGTNTKVAVLDERFEVLARHSFASEGDEGPDAYARRLPEQLGVVLDEHGAPDAVGFSVAALVDDHHIPVAAPNLPSFVGVDLTRLVLGALGDLPVVVENDVNAAVVGEHQIGAGRGLDHLCMLSLGTGVGGGLVLEGRLYHGAGGLAGELGHTLLDLEGPLCACGQRGHVESYLSTAAIVERAKRAMRAARAAERAALERGADENRGRLTPRVIAQCAADHDALALRLLAETGRYLGAACASLVHALHPARVIVGGGVAEAGDLLLEPARAELRARGMTEVARAVPIVRAELGVHGAAIGAAILARRALDA